MLVLICRELTGGIRKHIVAILENYEHSPKSVRLVTNMSVADSAFKKFLDEYPEFKMSIIDLPIKRSPHPADMFVLLDLYKKLSPLRTKLVFHGHGAKGGVLARLLGRWMGAKTVYTPHGGSVHPMFGSLKNSIYILIEQALYFLTDTLVFESQYSFDAYAKRIHKESKKFRLNTNGIKFESEPIHRMMAQKPFVIGAFGALRKLKGFDLLVLAAAELKDLDIEVRIYGAGEEANALQKLIDQKSSPVKLMGETPTPLAKMKECDLVVQPSRFESFGYTALEAISLGVPVIVSDAGGLSEIVEDGRTGLVFSAGDTLQLAEKTRQLIEDKDKRESLSREAYAYCKSKFNQNTMLKNLIKVYEI